MKQELKKESLKAKATKFWEKYKGVIVFIGGTAACIASIVITGKAYKQWETWLEQNFDKDSYEPHRLFDKNGKEFRLFKWDSGNDGNEKDMMYFPDCQIGWANEIDWDKL